MAFQDYFTAIKPSQSSEGAKTVIPQVKIPDPAQVVALRITTTLPPHGRPRSRAVKDAYLKRSKSPHVTIDST